MDNLFVKEMSKKYRGTLAAFTDLDTGEVFPVEVIDVASDANGIANLHGHKAVMRRGVIDVEAFIKPLHRVEVLPMPDRQVFDRGGMTVIYERYPQRQWQKGLCGNNTRLYNIVADIVRSGLPRSPFFELTGVNFRENMTIQSLYNLFVDCHASSFKAAIKEITTENLLSRSFSKSCFLVQIPAKEFEFILFRFEIPLATYELKSNTFKLYDKTYYQEVLDLINRQDLNSKIEVSS